MEGAAFLPPSPVLPLTYAQVMEGQRVSIAQSVKVSKELMEMLHEKAPSLAAARGPSEPVPAKNVGLALVNGKRLVLCGGCGYGFSAAYSSTRVNARPHHFCHRERGEPIPLHCEYSPTLPSPSTYTHKTLYKTPPTPFSQAAASSPPTCWATLALAGIPCTRRARS